MILPKYDNNYKANFKTLETTLIKSLPKEIYGFKKKEDFKFRYLQPTKKALDNCKWITYNENWVTFIIIDIDTQNKHTTISKLIDLDLLPSFICDTDKGCHCFFELKRHIKYEWTKSIKWLKNIQKGLMEKLDGDKHAARLKGIWRNPLLHDFEYFGTKFELEDFKNVELPLFVKKDNVKTQFKKQVLKTQINENRENFKKGNRNNILFKKGMFFSYSKNLSDLELFNYLENINKGSLNEQEVLKIVKSIQRYNEEDKNYCKPLKNYGVMNFEKIKGLSKIEYEKEVKSRQKKGIDYVNKNYTKEQQMTRVEHCKKLNEKKKESNYQKIKMTLENEMLKTIQPELWKKNGKPNGKKLQDYLKLSKTTILNGIKRWENEQ